MHNNGFGINSEWRKINKILLYKPSKRISQVSEPIAVMHEEHIEYDEICEEYDTIIKTYSSLGIAVELFQDDITDDSVYNMMFMRDLLFMTPYGAIISKMKYPIRYKEPCYVEKKLQELNIQIISKIIGEGTFEGADALWIKGDIVLVAVGNRTNEAGYRQLKNVLENFKVKCIRVPLPRGIQHLLGVVQVVDKHKALVRTEIVSTEIIDNLEKNDINIIPIPESEEVYSKQAMNIVTVAPSKIIMPKDCLLTKKLYLDNNIQVVATVDINEIKKAVGGLACATLILNREIKGRVKK